ncbi:hypothetical protein E8E11_011629 [Didymella keratinophila]|nr:hypothetical protein E8E11_011629 [Didymella keratinophila]
MSTKALSEQALTARIYLDGTMAAGVTYKEGKFKLDKSYIQEGRICADGQQTMVQAFHFGEMSIVKSSESHLDEALLNELKSCGTVKVALQGAKNLTDGNASSPLHLPDVKEVPEKAFKGQAKAHTAILAKPKQTSSTSWIRSDDVDGERHRGRQDQERKTEKRKPGIIANEDSDATNDFEVTEARSTRRRTFDPKDVIVID